MARLCRFYPGYTLESLRRLPLEQYGVLVDEYNRHHRELDRQQRQRQGR